MARGQWKDKTVDYLLCKSIRSSNNYKPPHLSSMLSHSDILTSLQLIKPKPPKPPSKTRTQKLHNSHCNYYSPPSKNPSEKHACPADEMTTCIYKWIAHSNPPPTALPPLLTNMNPFLPTSNVRPILQRIPYYQQSDLDASLELARLNCSFNSRYKRAVRQAKLMHQMLAQHSRDSINDSDYQEDTLDRFNNRKKLQSRRFLKCLDFTYLVILNSPFKYRQPRPHL